MKKKLMVWLMLLMMMVSTMAAGFAAPYDTTIFDEDYIKEVIMEQVGEEEGDLDTYRDIREILYDNDLIYILLQKHIYVYDIKAEKTTLVTEFLKTDSASLWFSSFEEAEKALGDQAERLINHLFVWEGKLDGINKFSGKAFPIDQENGGILLDQAIELPWKEERNEETEEYVDVAFQGMFYDKLYFTRQVYSNNGYAKTNAFSIDLATKELTEYNNPNVKRVMAYKDQGLLIVAFDDENAYNEETNEMNPMEIRAFPAGELDGEGTLVAQVRYDTKDIAYNEKEDALYYTYSGKIYKLVQGQEPVQVGYALNTYGDGNQKAWVTQEDLYITWGGWTSGINVKNLDPQYMPKASLVINGGGYNDQANKAFSAKYPDVPIVVLSWEEETINSEQALTQAIQSGETSTDIYFVSPGYFDFKNIMKKEYALALNGSQTISDNVGRMYPFIQQAITYNGQIYGVPEDVYIYSNLSVLTESWKEVGFSEEDIPKTYMEFLELAKQWYDGLNEEHSEYSFLGGYDSLSQSDLIDMMINEYINYYQYKKELLNFDTPLFRKLIEKIGEIDIPVKRDEDYLSGGMVIMGDDYQKELFMRGGSSLLQGGSDRYYTGLYLPLDEGMELGYPVGTQVAFVNPRSQNQELALAYLEEITNTYQPVQQTTMYQDVNEPIKSEYYEERVKDMEKYIKEYEKQLETAEAEDKKGLEEAIKALTEDLENKDQWYWEVDQKGLDQFNGLLPSFFIKESEILYSGEDEGNLYALLQNYVDGAMSLDQFISEANRRVQMAAMENQ